MIRDSGRGNTNSSSHNRVSEAKATTTRTVYGEFMGRESVGFWNRESPESGREGFVGQALACRVVWAGQSSVPRRNRQSKLGSSSPWLRCNCTSSPCNTEPKIRTRT
ncbi:hypothetical protein BH23PLA1_BH23PLA1_10980 [soil metagenome]